MALDEEKDIPQATKAGIRALVAEIDGLFDHSDSSPSPGPNRKRRDAEVIGSLPWGKDASSAKQTELETELETIRGGSTGLQVCLSSLILLNLTQRLMNYFSE